MKEINRMPNKSEKKGFSRRDFLKNGTATAFLLGTGFWTKGCVNGETGNPKRARNIIFMVSDGMSIGTLTSADLTMKRKLGRESNWMRLYRTNACRRALMDVAVHNALVPDSAASAAAWGCGHRIPPRFLNIGANGEHYKPINTIFREAGKSTGLVTTTRITHATPAGFTANVDHRDKEDEIALQYHQRAHDVYLGGGYKHFNANGREDDIDLIGHFTNSGYHVVRNRQDLLSVGVDGKLIGLFSESHLPYSLDRVNTPELGEQVPTLPEMTSKALERLNRNPNGFILQVEGGRVDHGAHWNDVGALIYDQIEFDDAIGVVLKFSEANPDTLIIITTDHGNSSPTLNRSQNGYDASAIEFDRVHNLRYTNSWALEGLNDSSSVAEIINRVEEATAISIKSEEANALQQAIQGTYRALYHPMMSDRQSVLGQILANYFSISWTGTNHTGDYVELAALGPGSEMIDGLVLNTQIFDIILQASQIYEKV